MGGKRMSKMGLNSNPADAEVGRGEHAEHERMEFISKQDWRRRRDEGKRPAEMAWKKNSRRYAQAREREHLRAKLAHMRGMLRSHTRTLEDFRARYQRRIACLEEPWSIVRRYRDLSRRAVQRHRDTRLAGGGGAQAMAPCSGIRADGGRCEAQAIRDSSHCVNHHPDYAEARKRRARKGGKRGVAVPLQSLRGYRSDSRSWPIWSSPAR